MENGEEEEEEAEEVDEMEFAPEISILPELGKKKFGEDQLDFSTAIGSKKWKDRGAALDGLA